MTRPTLVVPPLRRAARIALLAAAPLLGACARHRLGQRCDRKEFLYTERTAGADGALVERPVYGCAADSTAAPALAK